MKKEYYAHSLAGRPSGEWHRLDDHLQKVGEIARDFGQEFNAGEWGYLAGLWHDLGKYSKDFQARLLANDPECHIETKPRRPDHSTAGGLNAIERFGIAGRLLSYIIAGHHAGMPDWAADQIGRAALSQRLLNRELLTAALENDIPAGILEQQFPVEKPTGRDPALWLRMLFSCVVDADYLDTEEFFDRKRLPAAAAILLYLN